MRTELDWKVGLTRVAALLLAAGIVAIGAVVFLRTAPHSGGADTAAFSADDIARTGLTVRAVETTAGLLSREEALAIARENTIPPTRP
jgi:hypothetical protein